MTFWLFFVIGFAIGAAPALVARARYQAWWARRWWQLAVGLIVIALVLPFGIVLILFLIDSAWDAIGEMWVMWSRDFRGLAGFALGWLAGSSALAWRHRHAPYLQGPPLSDEVKALAREPDRQADAVRAYRLDTGTDLAVAIDIVEQFGTTREGAAQCRPAGALEWMYFGFASAWYVVFAAFYLATFHDHGNHLLVALGCFLFFPALFSGFCGLCGSVVSIASKAALDESWQRGFLTRPYAIGAGAAAGVLSIAGVLGGMWVLYPLTNSEIGLVAALTWVAAVLAGAPFFGLWLLRRR
jgi:hypothetical protein